MVYVTQTELDAILAEVQRDLDGSLATERARLAKAADEASPESSPPAKDDMPSDADPKPAEDTEAPKAPPVDADMSPPDAKPEASDLPGEEGGDHLDLGALKDEYAGLPDHELEIHFAAIKAAMMDKAKGGSASPSPSPSASLPPAPPSPSASPALKAEKPAEMSKSEQELIKGIQKENSDLRLQLEGLTKAVSLIVSQPSRKAIVGQSQLYLAKGEEQATPSNLSRDEAIALLREKAKTNLSKSDRGLINQFCIGSVDLSQVAHLLK